MSALQAHHEVTFAAWHFHGCTALLQGFSVSGNIAAAIFPSPNSSFISLMNGCLLEAVNSTLQSLCCLAQVDGLDAMASRLGQAAG